MVASAEGFAIAIQKELGIEIAIRVLLQPRSKKEERTSQLLLANLCPDEKARRFPNTHTFNILVAALCRAGDERRAGEFLEEIESEGFDPDAVTYNTLIGAYYSRRGRLDNATALYKVMYRRGVEPDLITYTLLVKGFCKEGWMGDAHRVFDRMLERGLHPDTFCFGVIIVGWMLGDQRRLSVTCFDTG